MKKINTSLNKTPVNTNYFLCSCEIKLLFWYCTYQIDDPEITFCNQA